MASPLHPVKKLIKDLFTGPDGETWAIGRFYSIPMMVAGLAVPFTALAQGQTVSLADLGILLPGTAGACLLLIRGTNNVDVDLTDPAHPKLKDK